jgi:hypothetical protein
MTVWWNAFASASDSPNFWPSRTMRLRDVAMIFVWVMPRNIPSIARPSGLRAVSLSASSTKWTNGATNISGALPPASSSTFTPDFGPKPRS